MTLFLVMQLFLYESCLIPKYEKIDAYVLENLLCEFQLGNYQALFDRTEFNCDTLLPYFDNLKLSNNCNIEYLNKQVISDGITRYFYYYYDGHAIKVDVENDSLILLDYMTIPNLFSKADKERLAWELLDDGLHEQSLYWAFGFCKMPPNAKPLFARYNTSLQICLNEKGLGNYVYSYFELLRNKGNKEAAIEMYNYLILTKKKDFRPSQERENPMYWLELAAEEGHLIAMNNLAVDYLYSGKYEAAFELAKKVYVHKKSAIFIILDALEEGDIDITDEENDRYWDELFQLGREDSKISYDIGDNYYWGLSPFQEDRDKAIEWYKISHNLGSSKAKRELEKMGIKNLD